MSKKNIEATNSLKVSKTPNSNLTSNLQFLMKKTKVTSVNLADSIDVSAELIGKLKNGWLSNPSLKVLAGLAKHFQISLHELVYTDLKSIGDSILIKPVNYIPVVDWTKIKTWRNEQINSTVATENIAQENVFALNLSHDYGEFEKGSHIFVHTEALPKNNDYVLVYNKGSKTFNLKKIIIDDYHYLQSIIADISNVVKLNEQEHKIYGVIVGYQNTKTF